MDCRVIFRTTNSDDDVSVLPSHTQFLLDMNADYMLDQFVEPHLRTLNDNLFQWSSKVGYITTNVGVWQPLEVVEKEEVDDGTDMIVAGPTTTTTTSSTTTTTTNTTTSLLMVVNNNTNTNTTSTNTTTVITTPETNQTTTMTTTTTTTTSP